MLKSELVMVKEGGRCTCCGRDATPSFVVINEEWRINVLTKKAILGKYHNNSKMK
jgi:hypothetical protein